MTGLVFTAVASAALTVTPNGPSRVEFRDTGPDVTNNLTVQATDDGTTVTVLFTENTGAALTPTFPCQWVGGLNTPQVTCPITKTGDETDGVDIVLGGGGVQFAALSGAGWGDLTNTIIGGPGNDTLNGNTGKETFQGGTGGDAFSGNLGEDAVSYADHATAVVAAIDNNPTSGTGTEGDTISDTIENLTGGSGNDVLTGSALVNTLLGGGGNDTLNGLAGIYTIAGSAGNDTLIGGLGNDALNGGADVDTISYLNDGRSAGVTVNLDPGSLTATSGAEADTLTASTIENITGSVFGDTLTGDTGDNVIDGQAGNDTIKGDSNNAQPRGADEVFGGAGTDVFSYDDGQHATGVSVSLDDVANDGLADADTGTSGTQPEGDNIHADIENLVGTAGPDVLSGSTAANVLNGGSGGPDTISYQGRSDAITASLATNTGPEGDTFVGTDVSRLLGGAGNDTLIGNASGNRLDGAGGNDTLVGALGGDALVGGSGTNTADYSQDARGTTGVDVDLSAGLQTTHGSSITEDTLTGVQNVIGTKDDDVLVGSIVANTLVGGAGTDQLDGSAGDDLLDPGTGTGDQVIGGNDSDTVTYAGRTAPVTITLDNTADDGEAGENDKVFPSVENALGGSAADTITGSSLANVIDGGAGGDTITTLAGNDTVTGGAGSDSISTGDGDDTVKLVDQTADQATSCGAGADTADADDIDPLNADCETVTRTAVPVPPGNTPTPAASTVSVDNPAVNEGNAGTTPMVFTVTLSPAQPGAVTVPVATTDLTATAGSDYTAISGGAVTFAPGETSKSVTVTVTGDTLFEAAETLGLGLGTPQGNAVLGAPGYGIGTIANDDAQAPVSKQRPKALSLSVSPARDRTAPFRFVASGRLTRPAGVTAADGCKGKVRVQLKGPRGTLQTRTARVRSTCRYRTVLRRANTNGVGPSGRVRVIAKFLGNAALKSKLAPSRTVRIG